MATNLTLFVEILLDISPVTPCNHQHRCEEVVVCQAQARPAAVIIYKCITHLGYPPIAMASTSTMVKDHILSNCDQSKIASILRLTYDILNISLNII